MCEKCDKNVICLCTEDKINVSLYHEQKGALKEVQH